MSAKSKRRIITVWGEIDSEATGEITSALLESLHQSDPKVTLLINSPGGDLHQAFGLIDLIQSLPFEIQTVAQGQICSAGLMLFMCGSERLIFPNTVVMSHRHWLHDPSEQYSTDQIESMSKSTALISKMILDYYKRQTGLSTKEIEPNLLKSTDTWLSAKEAVKYGLADRIVRRIKW